MPKKPASTDAARLKSLPKVDKVMRLLDVERLIADEKNAPTDEHRLPRWAVLTAVRDEIARLRAQLLANPATESEPTVDVERIAAAAQALVRPSLQPIINATGVVLHTNLGRAPLPQAALDRIAQLGGGYMTLEYRLADGERGSRQDHLQDLLSRLVGAEASLVVNNNAAAVLLMLSGLCAGGQVVVSRGELVEIGGSFRVPDVMRASGATLCEVGTTNRTHLRDYQAAIAEATRALLKVHRSNFAVVGFTAEVDAATLARCAHEAGLLCLYDLGSGCLDELDGAGEPTITQALRAGCDVVSFSCDKLLGGPQAGVLCGTRAAIEPLRKHPLLRALRPDKLTLLALAATLELHRDGRTAEIPTLAMLRCSLETLRARAESLQALCGQAGLAVDVIETQSVVGGGALPLHQPASFAVSPRVQGAAARHLETALRRPRQLAEPPTNPSVVARLHDERLLCDVRTVTDSELPALARALALAATEGDVIT